MLRRPIVVHPAAIYETQAAVDWYRTKSPSAARTFLKELDHAISIIEDKPEIWPQYVQDTQRYLLHRFPFSVIYRLTPKRIEVLAVAHARRKPQYWKERLS